MHSKVFKLWMIWLIFYCEIIGKPFQTLKIFRLAAGPEFCQNKGSTLTIPYWAPLKKKQR